jgi:hypothetical protein
MAAFCGYEGLTALNLLFLGLAIPTAGTSYE